MQKTSHKVPDTEVRNQPDFGGFPSETEEERVNRLMEKYFFPHYSSQEEFEKDLYEKIEIAHKQIEEGKGIPAEIAFKELEAKYGLHE